MHRSLRGLALVAAILAGAPASAADTTIGFIYVGPKDDYGCGQTAVQARTSDFTRYVDQPVRKGR